MTNVVTIYDRQHFQDLSKAIILTSGVISTKYIRHALKTPKGTILEQRTLLMTKELT